MLNIDLDYVIQAGTSLEKLEQCLIDQEDSIQEIKTGSESWARLESILESASSIVNGYCRPRYGDVMPWETVPAAVKEFTLALAIVRIFRRRNAVREEMERAENETMKSLRDVSRGLLKLEIENEGELDQQVPENSIQFTNKTVDDLKFGGSEGPAGFYET